jgi:FAD/FMN-containing dehydrogenase
VLWAPGCVRWALTPSPTLVNDIHAQLNPTHVYRLVKPDSIQALQEIVRKAITEGRAISIAGGRHAMGGQQFGADTFLVDMTLMNRVVSFDPVKGVIEVEAGLQWPELIDYLLRVQTDRWPQWGIIQKQTGADRLSIGGALSANIHGRGLRFTPIIGDVESFVLVDAEGKIRSCSRTENTELFRLAIGGYGLFGIIATVKLRLMPRTKLERVVEVIEVKDLMPSFEKRIAEGFLYGDCQYTIARNADDFLRRGIFSCYRPVDESRFVPEAQKELSAEDWRQLYYLAHTDQERAFEKYAKFYLSTSGQVYWSDTHQLSVYIDNYHQDLDRRLGATVDATEMITEIYIPPNDLVRFLADVREDFRENKMDLIYGTIRLIERDDESFLAWAKERYACVIFNLHVPHSTEGLERAAQAFRRLIDLAIPYGGSYFLTYHRWATRKQMETCYPQFADFLRLKRKYDREERFQSEWYRHYRRMFGT